MSFLSKIFSPSVVKAAEGEYRPGPWTLPITGGWLSHDVGQYINWWQNGHDPRSSSCSAMVEACVSSYSQTVAMCPGDHWLKNDKDGRDRVTTSALSRILRRPNSYQSGSDFLLNLTRSLYTEGNAYALALRNNRFEIAELHLMRSNTSAPLIAETGEIFYELSGNQIVERMIQDRIVVPARDVMHVKLHTPTHPLIGVSPLIAAALDIAAGDAMMRQQILFYMNQGRPSTVLTTDMILKREQVADLRAIWDEQSRGLGTGGTPILTSGLKPVQLGSNNRDAQFADAMKMNEQHIALAFRVPLQVLGIGGTTFSSTEALMQFWLAGGLNFCLNHIEVAFDALFGLKGPPDEYTELSTDVLLRSELKNRVESYAAGTRAGIFAPNEARAQFELPKAKDGDDPRMQQQDVPLSFGAELEPPAPAAPAAPPADPAPPDNQDQPEDEQSASFESDAIIGRLYDHASLH